MIRSLALAAVLLGGCTLYWNDDHDDGTADAGPCSGDGPSGAPLALRNPENLACVSFGGDGSCDPQCGPCPLAGADQAPAPAWGVCGGPCDVLSEAACVVAPACRAAYDYDCYTGTGTCSALQPFLGCFALSQSSSSGACEGLDSWSCSSRSDCVALHHQVCDASGACWPQFFECRTENR
jgi:hypothetical protein